MRREYILLFVVCVLVCVVGQDVPDPTAPQYETSCGTRYTDPASSALLADIVLQGVVSQLRQASPLAPHLYKANVTVNKVYKGQDLLPGGATDWRTRARHLTVERFGPEENKENCVARVVSGQTYLFFLRPKAEPSRPEDAASSGRSTNHENSETVFRHTALPLEMDLKVLRQVKRVLCDGCASRPVIKRLRCKNCAVKPKMKRKMAADDTKLVRAGKKLTLRCVARGVPRPTYTWYKDGRRLGDTQSTENSDDPTVYRSGGLAIRTSRRHSLLVIKSVSAADQGEYRCIAANAMGEEEQTAQVVVQGGRPSPNPAADVTTARTADVTPAPAGEITSDACSINPCYHGGTCYTKQEGGRAYCECSPDYHGRTCQFRRRKIVDTDPREENRVTDIRGRDESSEPSRPDGGSSASTSQEDDLELMKKKMMAAGSLNSDTDSHGQTTLHTDLSRLETTEGLDSDVVPDIVTPETPAPPAVPDTKFESKKRRKYPVTARGRYGSGTFESGSAKSSKSESVAPKLKVADCPDETYCKNGGICKIVVKIQRRFCECPRGFGGRQCERRTF